MQQLVVADVTLPLVPLFGGRDLGKARRKAARRMRRRADGIAVTTISGCPRDNIDTEEDDS